MKVKPLCAHACIALGMFGLYSHIEYSGWVIFVGAWALLETA